MSVETSLKELEDDYESKPEWKVIEDGGVLSIPVEELRMENPPRPVQRPILLSIETIFVVDRTDSDQTAIHHCVGILFEKKEQIFNFFNT